MAVRAGFSAGALCTRYSTQDPNGRQLQKPLPVNDNSLPLLCNLLRHHCIFDLEGLNISPQSSHRYRVSACSGAETSSNSSRFLPLEA